MLEVGVFLPSMQYMYFFSPNSFFFYFKKKKKDVSREHLKNTENIIHTYNPSVFEYSNRCKPFFSQV